MGRREGGGVVYELSLLLRCKGFLIFYVVFLCGLVLVNYLKVWCFVFKLKLIFLFILFIVMK